MTAIRPGSITVAYCHGGQVEGLFLDSMVRLGMSPFGQRLVFSSKTGGGVLGQVGTRITRNRNALCHEFLAGPGEWMLMIDTDHTFSPEMVERLYYAADPAAAPVIGALCFGRALTGEITPTMYRMARHQDNPEELIVTVIESWTPGDIVEVHGTGAAFLLVHRTVLEAMQAVWPGTTSWFFEGATADGKEFGEDIFFCQRARRVGVTIRVHTGCEAPHLKPILVASDDYRMYLALRDRVGVNAIVQHNAAKIAGYVPALTDEAPSSQVRPQPGGVVLNREQRRAQAKAGAQ